MSWTHFLSFHYQTSFFPCPPPTPHPLLPQSIQEIYTDFFISQWKKTICLFPWNQKLRPLVWHNKQNKVNPTWDTTIVKAACYTYSYFWRKTQVKNIFFFFLDKQKWQNPMTVQAQFIQQEQNIALSFLSQWSRWSQIYIYIHSTCIKKHQRIYKKQWGEGVGILIVGLKQEWVSKWNLY